MKSKIKEWQVKDVYQRRYNIKPAVFQRSDVWSLRQRRLLIDSILKEIDIPKIYLERSEKKIEWDIIDGHQRIDSINAFLNNEFEVDGQLFKDMLKEKKETIEN